MMCPAQPRNRATAQIAPEILLPNRVTLSGGNLQSPFIGVHFRRHGVMLWDDGVRFQTKQTTVRRNGVSFRNDGARHRFDGVTIRDVGVPFCDVRAAFWNVGVSARCVGVSLQNDGVSPKIKGFPLKTRIFANFHPNLQLPIPNP
jgi:hypothetical protein